MTPSARQPKVPGSRVVSHALPTDPARPARSAAWLLVALGIFLAPALSRAQNVVVDVAAITIYEVDNDVCGSATFEVSLNADPGEEVTVDIQISDPTQAVISDPEELPLQFDETNFNQVQVVTVRAVLDGVPDGDFVGTIILTGPAGGATIALTVVDLDGGNATPLIIGTVDNPPDELGFMTDGDDELVLSLDVFEVNEDTCNPPEDTVYLFASIGGGDPFPVRALRDIETLTVFAGDGNDLVDASRLVPDPDADPPVRLPPISIFGNAGNDRLIGSQGDDYIEGGTGSDYIVATRGNDTLKGDSAALASAPTDVNTLSYERNPGGQGVRLNLGAPLNDLIVGFVGLGEDDLGPAGTARKTVEDPGEDEPDFEEDTILEATDPLPDLYPSSAATVYSFGTIIGSPAGDVLIGQAARPMVIRGEDGNDKIVGGGGPDTIRGGAGDDRIYGGDQSDDMNAFCLREQFGDPDLEAIFNPNTPYCDFLSGGPGNDRIHGGAGNDDLVDAGVEGEEETNLLIGGPGSDRLTGGWGDDTLEGGPGNDVLRGGRGDNIISGGPGFDLLDYRGAEVGVVINLGAALEEEIGVPPGTGLNGLGGTDTLIAEPGNFIEAVRGSAFPDRLAGNLLEPTVLLGGPDNDTLYGGHATDYLFGEFGNDTIIAQGELVTSGIGEHGISGKFIYGGAGNDNIRGSEAGDYIFGDGDDLPDTNGNFIPDFFIAEPCDPVLRPDVPCDDAAPTQLLNPGLQDIREYISRDPVFGQPTQLVIPGYAGNDTIEGWPGPDVIVGGAGSDTIYGCAEIVFDDDTGRIRDDIPEVCTYDYIGVTTITLDADLVFGGMHVPFDAYFVSAGDAIHSFLTVDILTPWDQPGPTSGNTIRGGPGSDWIIGGGGSHRIYGDGGPDTIWGDYQYDTNNDGEFDFDPELLPFFLASGNDIIHGGLGTDQPSAFVTDMGDRLYGGPGNDSIYGGPGADIIQGNAGNDLIVGGSPQSVGLGYTDSSLGDVVDYTTAKVKGDPPEGQVGGVVVDLGWSHNDSTTTLKDQCTGFEFINGRACNDGDDADPLFAPGVRGRDTLIGIDHVLGTERDDIIFGTNDLAPERDPLVTIELQRELSAILYHKLVEDFWTGAPLDVVTDEVFEVISRYDNLLVGFGGNDIIMGRRGNDLILGGDGDDLICGDVNIICDPVNVASRGASKIGDHDFLIGGDGDDTIYGDGGDDVIRGGTGFNTLSGGYGVDMLDYSHFVPSTLDPDYDPAIIANLRTLETIDIRLYEDSLDRALGTLGHSKWVDLAGNPIAPLFSDAADDDDLPEPISDDGIQSAMTVTNPGRIRLDGQVIPRGLDRIITPTDNDSATPDYNELEDRFNIIFGTVSNDVIFLTEDRSMIAIGWSGNDVIVGAYDDPAVSYTIFGDAPVDPSLLPPDMRAAGVEAVEPGNNVIEGGLGDDQLVGGTPPAGTLGNILSYAGAPAGVEINLSSGNLQDTGSAGSDTVSGFTNVIGSAHNDTFIGDGHNNYFFGGPGDDTYFGGPGDNLVRDGDGDDTADYRSFIHAIDPDDFEFDQHPSGEPDDWTVQNGIWITLPDGTERFGIDELFGVDVVLRPADEGPGTGTGPGGQVPAPVQVTIGAEVEIQSGGTAVLTFFATGGVPPYTAKWDPTTIVNTSVNPPRTDTVLFWDQSTEFAEGQEMTAQASPLSTMTFRVTVKDSIGTVDEEFVKVIVADTLEVTAGPDRIIALGEVATFSPAVTGGVQPYAYLWTPMSGDGGFVTAPTVARAQVSPTETTSYTLEVTDALGTQGFDIVEVRVGGTTPGEGTFTPDPDLDQSQQNPGLPDDDADDTDDDAGDSDDDANGGTSPQPQAPAENETRAPALCGSGMGSALMAVNLLAFAVMKRRRRGRWPG